MDTLFLIVARAGSKGLPGKNIKRLNNKPLIYYSIDVARKFVSDEFICVSTNDEEVISLVEEYNLPVPFKRPEELATDEATTYDVIIHALGHYRNKHEFKKLVLLQPTSPFRLAMHVKDALAIFDPAIDAVISVKHAHGNPYQLLYKQSAEGFLERVLDSPGYQRRQDMPEVFEINGCIYIYNVASLYSKKPNEFSKVKHYLMPEENSVDIDTPLDWAWAEFLLEKNFVQLDHHASLPSVAFDQNNKH